MGMEEPDYTRSYGAELAKHGYVVYAPYVFNASHYNSNFGALGMLYSGDTKFSLDIQKLMAVVDLVKADPKVSKLPLVLWGVSYGSRLSVYMTAIDQRIEAMVVNGGFLHHKDFLAENFSFGRENHAFVEDVLLNHALYQTFDSADLARLIAPRPMLLELPAYDLDPFPETVVEIWKRIEELYKAENAGASAKLIWFKGYHETAPAVTIPVLDTVVAELRR